jgi:preprotein translocase subunit SecA
MIDYYFKDNMMHVSEVLNIINTKAKETLHNKFASINDDEDYAIEKRIWLNIVDSLWRDHLAMMDYLKQIVNLRAFAQKDPFTEYAREAFEMFTELRNNISFELIQRLCKFKIIHHKNEDKNEDNIIPKEVMPVKFI